MYVYVKKKIQKIYDPFVPPGGNTSTRERCGSMPSRSRTSSEGSVQNAPSKHQAVNCSHQLDGPLCLHVTRPQSMYSPSLSTSCSPPFYVLFRYLSAASERPNHHHHPGCCILECDIDFFIPFLILNFFHQ